VLNYAKLKNNIDRIPSVSNTIVSCYRLGANVVRTGTGAPLPVILKLTNDSVKLAILRNKRLATPTSQEKDLGILRFTIEEDLTPPCFKLLRDLQRNEDDVKVWTVDGRIRWMLKDS
jgi:hypothetical protein